MEHVITPHIGASCDVITGGGLDMGVLHFKNRYDFECFGPDGKLKWRKSTYNTVVNVGLDDVLDKYFKGSAYTAAFYVGLTDGAPVTVAAADTMASHAGWAEIVPYSDATRPALTLGTVASQSVDNSASKAVFNINTGPTTVGGAFLATSATKSETASLLYGAAAFTAGDKGGLNNGDVLNVTVTLTAA